MDTPYKSREKITLLAANSPSEKILELDQMISFSFQFNSIVDFFEISPFVIILENYTSSKNNSRLCNYIYNSKFPSNSKRIDQIYICWLITNLKNRRKEYNKNIQKKSQINGKNFAKLFQKKKKWQPRYLTSTILIPIFSNANFFVDKSLHHGGSIKER